MASTPSVTAEQIAAVRGFSRFYTRQLGLLNRGLLQTRFSLTEARVIFELANRQEPTARELAGDLGLDAGYLSRLLKKFSADGLVKRTASPTDGRRALLTLTPEGRKAYRILDKHSSEQVADLLADMPGGDRKSLVEAMWRLRHIMGDPGVAATPYVLRGLRPGDIGWIIHRQGLLYYEEYGWDETFEALVAQILATFVKSFDPDWERAWVVEQDSQVIGSVFVVKESDTVAKLRLLYVDRAARGLGIGHRLVDECIQFSRARGYKTLTLWTNDILESARRIYVAAGFRRVAQEAHRSFGKDLIGQNWDLDL